MSDHRRRVAVVASTFPPSLGGGVASAHQQLAVQLAKAGSEVRRFSFLDGGASSPEILRCDASPVWKKSTRGFCKLLFRILDNSGRAYQTADILECQPGARRIRNAIAAFSPHEIILPDHGCPGLALGVLPAGARVTLVAHHNPMRFIDQPGVNPHSRLDARLAVALENLALAHVQRVVAPCHYMAERFRATYRFSGPIEVIPNLADAEALDAITPYDPRLEMGLAKSAPLVYIPSAGSPFKGAALLVELVQRLIEALPKPFGLYLSGAVPPPLLRALPDGLACHAPGTLTTDQNLARVKCCTLAVSPALIENFSMALLEAQLMGLPVACFDVGGNGELVVEGKTGRLVKRGDTTALATGAVDLIATASPEQAAFIRATSRSRFDPAHWLVRWLN